VNGSRHTLQTESILVWYLGCVGWSSTTCRCHFRRHSTCTHSFDPRPGQTRSATQRFWLSVEWAWCHLGAAGRGALLTHARRHQLPTRGEAEAAHRLRHTLLFLGFRTTPPSCHRRRRALAAEQLAPDLPQATRLSRSRVAWPQIPVETAAAQDSIEGQSSGGCVAGGAHLIPHVERLGCLRQAPSLSGGGSQRADGVRLLIPAPSHRP
jgi:hypothetical protein